MKGKLFTIAILTEPEEIPRWQGSVLEGLAAEEENWLIHLPVYPGYRGGREGQERYPSRIDRSMVKMMSRVPVLRSHIGVFEDALEGRPVCQALPDIDRLALEWDGAVSGEGRLTKASLVKVRAADIDLVIDFCGGFPYDELPDYTGTGILTYSLSLSPHDPGFALRLYTSGHREGTEVYRERLEQHILEACSTNNLLWTLAKVLPEQVKRLKQHGVTGLAGPGNRRTTACPQGPEYPGRPKGLHTVCSYLRYVVDLLDSKLFYRQWYLLLLQKPDGRLHTGRRTIPVVPPNDRFWADCFAVRKDDVTCLFVEEEMRDTGKGHIAVVILDSNGEIIDTRPLIQNTYHMSYPYIFTYSNDIYMIPEANRSNAITLYKCTAFPYEWKPVAALMEGIKAVDASVVYYRGLWWMFLGVYSPDGSHNRRLYLYYTQELLGKVWTPHPMNPVVADAGGARNAGRIFEAGGVLYRPAQDCTKRYGYGVSLKRIVTLNTETYCEEEVYSVNADRVKGALGIHTVSRGDGITVVDILRRVPRFLAKGKCTPVRIAEADMHSLDGMDVDGSR